MKTRTYTLEIAFAIGMIACCVPVRAQEPPLPSGQTVRVRAVPVVNVYCTVRGRNDALLSDLTREEFKLSEDDQQQEISVFERQTDRPLTLAILLDTSISQQVTLPIEKEAVSLFVDQVLRPSDLALLVTFDTDVNLLQDFTSTPDMIREALPRARINAPGPTGPVPRSGPMGTRLYDAVYLAAQEKLKNEVGRKAIILVSDGVDAGSQVKEKAALEAAQRGNVIVYTIGVTDPNYYGNTYLGTGVLRTLANETGGFAVFPRNEAELREAFQRINEELRTQYLLSYIPTNRARDGRFRKIKVEIEGQRAKVQVRKGYYAPSESESPR